MVDFERELERSRREKRVLRREMGTEEPTERQLRRKVCQLAAELEGAEATNARLRDENVRLWERLGREPRELVGAIFERVQADHAEANAKRLDEEIVADARASDLLS